MGAKEKPKIYLSHLEAKDFPIGYIYHGNIYGKPTWDTNKSWNKSWDKLWDTYMGNLPKSWDIYLKPK